MGHGNPHIIDKLNLSRSSFRRGTGKLAMENLNAAAMEIVQN